MKTILFAEDTPELHDLMKGALEKAGYSVIGAKNGMEALRLFQSFPEIQAVVTDLEMPMMSGIQLTLAIREIDSQVPVIMWSGSDNPKMAQLNLFIEKLAGTKPVINALNTLTNGKAAA